VTNRGEMAMIAVVIGLGALLAIVAGGRPLMAGDGTGVHVSGGSSTATALGLVALAGAGALLLVRGWGRVGIGVVVTLAGAGVVAAGLIPRKIGGFAYGEQVPAFHPSVWGWLTAAGGVAVMLGGLVAIWRGRRWDAPAARSESGQRPDQVPARDTWDALDRGEDPTA
jgi:hypothetical protein